MKKCSIENCENKHYAKGVCKRHYDQIRCSGKIKDVFRNDKNAIRIIGDVAYIDIYNRKGTIKEVVQIDKEDVKIIQQYKWHLNNYGYAMTTPKKGKMILMHRLITNCPNNLVVDHINHIKTDNRKNNLKVCTQKENTQNRKEPAKGITKISRRNNVYYIVQLGGKYLGCFKNINDAIEKRKSYIRG